MRLFTFSLVVMAFAVAVLSGFALAPVSSPVSTTVAVGDGVGDTPWD